MTEISERYARLADAFAAKIAAVPEDRWSAPSPCENWTARDIVGHVVTTQGMFLGFVGRSLGDIPSVDDDPLGAFTAARTVVQADLEDPARAGTEFEGGMGTMTFETGVDRFLNFDLVVHGWDLARAAGLDDHIDPADLQRIRIASEGFGDAMRGPNAFGPEVEPPEGADEQQRVLAFLGRRV
jgi:uncharacterized protein (TIGR03086 family)